MPHIKAQPSSPSRAPQSSVPNCPYCQRNFTSMDEMTLHIVTRHTRTSKLSTRPLPATTAK